MAAAARFGYLGGGLLTTAGALGLAVTGVGDPLQPSGHHLLVFEVNPAQNVLHLLLGLAMVLGAAGALGTPRTVALVATSVLGTLGVVGLVLAGPPGNALGLDLWGNALHLVLAGWGAAATLRSASVTARPVDPSPRHP